MARPRKRRSLGHTGPNAGDGDDASGDWDEAVRDQSESVGLAKAHFIGKDVPGSNVQSPQDKRHDDRIFEKAGALAPPYSPDVMVKLFEHSNSLRQNVDAYVVNIDGHGHRFEPVIDLDADDAEEAVRDAMFLERLVETGDTAEEAEPPDLPTDEEVEARIEKMRHEMRLELAKLEAFFSFCCVDESFISLRMKARQDREVIGSGFWEVLRNTAGEPAQFTYVPAFTMRLLALDREVVEVTQRVKRAPLTYDEIPVKRRFRRFVQVFEGATVYFKEYGDPRIVSSATGRVYKTVEAMAEEEARGRTAPPAPATEILYFPIHSPRSPYGIPRWVGNLLAVLGSRQSEEVNFLYFENKSVPPLAILVSGGRLTADSKSKIESFIENRIKGRTNFHKVMVIEAVPADSAALDNASGRMKIEIVPLTMAQHGDGLFQKYDERNIDKVGMSFRLPRLLRGDIRDFNRATADAALEFAETQVFAPEREAFDWAMDRKILADLAVKFWEFRSNAPTTRNPLDLAQIVTALVKESILTPEEARELAEGIFNRDFKRIDEAWTKIPPALLLGGILPEGMEPPASAPGEEEPQPEPGQPTPPQLPTGEEPDDEVQQRAGERGPAQARGFVRLPPTVVGKRYRDGSRAGALRKLARDLVDLRAVLDEEARRLAKERFEADHDDEVERETIQIPAEEFAALVGQE